MAIASIPSFDFEKFLLEYRDKTVSLKATVDSLCEENDEHLDEENALKSISSDLESLNHLNDRLETETTTYEDQLSIVDDIKQRFEYITEAVDDLSNALTAQIINGAVVLPVGERPGDKSNKKAINNNVADKNGSGEARKMDFIPQIKIITNAEMAAVPPYMKGRMKAETINQFVDKFNRAILMKYQLLGKPKKTLKMDEKRSISIFKMQETDATKGLFFCTLDDLNEFSNYKFCNSTNSLLTMLRHCKRIREIREGKKTGLLVCLTSE